MELGYERAETGPTSNFVGNHMTQGAIDLVQAELERPAVATPAPLLALSASRPQLVGSSAGAPLERSLAVQQLQRYRWWDGGEVVHVEVPLEQLGAGGGGTVSMQCCFSAHSCALQLSVQPQGVGAAQAPAVAHRLQAGPLHGAIEPAACSCWVAGVLALPSSSAAKPDASVDESPIAQGGGADEHKIAFRVPPAATAVRLTLRKAGPSDEWPVLLGSSQPLAQAAERTTPPDLAALRRQLRQQRAGAGPSAACTASAAGGPEQQQHAVMVSQAAVWDLESWDAGVRRARIALTGGQHAEAAAACMKLADGLPQRRGAGPSPEEVAAVHMMHGECHTQLGLLKDALASFSAAVELGGGAASGGAQALVARAAVHEQLEQYDLALKDVMAAAAMPSGGGPWAVAAAQRLRRAAHAAELWRQEAGPSGGRDALPPSVPRASRLFTYGKARAAG